MKSKLKDIRGVLQYLESIGVKKNKEQEVEILQKKDDFVITVMDEMICMFKYKDKSSNINDFISCDLTEQNKQLILEVIKNTGGDK